MSRDDIKRFVNEVLCDVLDDPTLAINETMTAADVDNWDSLSHISIITIIEKQYGIRFTLSELDSFGNIGNLIDLIEHKISR
jgi:acyl carrier protein